MTFAPTRSGGWINVSRIESIDKINNKTQDYQATLINDKVGRREVLLGYGFDPAALQGTVVAATPGYTCLQCYDGDELWTNRVPIVAWRIEGDIAVPIALEDEAGDCIGLGILLPDGRVIEQCLMIYGDENAFLAEMAKRRKVWPERTPAESAPEPSGMEAAFDNLMKD